MKKKYIISGIIILILALPYLMVCKYIVPASDDFSYAWRSALYFEKYHNEFVAALYQTQNEYLKMQGTYFGSFLVFFWVQAGIRGNFVLIKVISFTSIVLLVFSVFEFISKIFEIYKASNAKEFSLGVYAAVFFTGMNMASPNENFYWLNGICFYTIPIIMTIWGSICLLDSYNQREKLVIPAIVVGILSAGGSLMIAALLNELYLGISLLNFFKYHNKYQKWNLKLIVPYIFILTATIINVLAPGNYMRHNSITDAGKLDFAGAIINTIYVLAIRMGELAFHSYFFMICCVLIATVWLFEFEIKVEYNFIWGWLFEPVSLLIVLFPVLLGYGGTGSPNRINSLIYSMIALETYLNIIYTTTWLKNRINKKERKNKLRIWGIVCILIVCFSVNTGMLYMRTYTASPYGIAIHELANGNLKAFSEKERQILSDIQNSEDEDVCVTDEIPEVKTLKMLELSKDASYWVNHAVATYYKKNSVIYQP